MKTDNPAMGTGWMAADLTWNVFPGSITRFAQLALGVASLKAVTLCFDYLLYPFVIYRFGVLCGGAVMTLLDAITCFVTLLFYDRSKRDWLGVESLKGLRDYDGDSKIRLLAAWLLRRRAVMFVVLSLRFDAFITTIYLRRGAYNGMTNRDWNTFRSSILLGNLCWISICFFGCEALSTFS